MPTRSPDAEHVTLHTTRVVALLALMLVVVGCATPSRAPSDAGEPRVAPARVQADQLDIRLIGSLAQGDGGTLVRDPGWLEYRLEIVNTGSAAVMIETVKLLTAEGRYLDSASDYQELSEPPDVAVELAGDIALRTAGVAAGQVIPYGGSIVGVLSGAAKAASSKGVAGARREFLLRRIKAVELAPGGRVVGSAFLPAVAGTASLVVDWRRDDRGGRLVLPASARSRTVPTAAAKALP